MKRNRATSLPIGTISAGTLNANELIPAWIDALSGIRLSKADRLSVRRLAAEWHRFDPETDQSYGETESGICDELQTIAESYAPDYAYVGTHPGDGAHFGCWPSIDLVTEELERLTELPPIDRRHSPIHVAIVTDHGNVTLYRRAGNRWREVWSVV